MHRLLWILLVLGSTVTAAADWVRVETPHFVVFGQSGDKKTRAIASEFERFREGLARVLPAAVESPVPTIVVLFDDERSMTPYVPRFNGRPIKLDGYFQGTETDNVIALSLAKRGDALRVVFHEYTHLVISGMARGLPAWVNEGIAEYYSTFEMREDGRGAVTGNVILSHLQLLNGAGLLTIDELLGVQRDSPLYNEGDRRSLFYAQSWGLVHMLMSGDASRAQAFSRYLSIAAGGATARDAWQQAFGNFDAIKELKSYVRRQTMRGFSYSFDDRIKAATIASSPAPAADVESALALLLRHIDAKEARERLTKAADARPPSMLGTAVLGLMNVDAKPAAAERLLLAAAQDPADWLAQYYAAAGLAHLVSGSILESERPRILAARAALATVMRARPELAHPHALMTFVAEPDQTIASAVTARAMAPGRSDYILLEAQARANEGQFASARELLAPLVTSRYPVEERNRARTLMGEIVTREHSARKPPSPSTQPPPREPVRVEEQGARTPPAQPPPANPVRVDEHGPGARQPIYRVTERGETRVEGHLARIVCARTGAVTFDVRVDGVIRHFSARALRDVAFITYRDNSPGAVACGSRTQPERVYVTWRPWTPAVRNVVGRVVAVELLPQE
ncbi:MAG: hypothetical protein ABIS06_14030 [Vicinamibacterales bacterium]